jgi:hypothetical protein
MFHNAYHRYLSISLVYVAIQCVSGFGKVARGHDSIDPWYNARSIAQQTQTLHIERAVICVASIDLGSEKMLDAPPNGLQNTLG